MPHVRTAPQAPKALWAPFRAYVRIVPFEGKPAEYYRDMERIANEVEEDLEAASFSSSADAQILNIATPVAFTPQFGDRTARLTIIGNFLPSVYSKTDRTDARLDHDNAPAQGQLGGPNQARTDPTTDTDEGVKELKALLENSSSWISGRIYKVEYLAAVYGENGRSFPV